MAKKTLFKRRFLRRLNHNIKSFCLERGTVGQQQDQLDDSILIERLKAHYATCDANFEGNKDSQWSGFFEELQGDIHSAFIRQDQKAITDILRNPKNYNLFYGFENLSRALLQNKRLEDILEPEQTMDCLLSLCEAVGVKCLSNPETFKIGRALNPEVAIELLEKEFGFSIEFPNPFEGEHGIEIKRGIISYRAIQAIYQAWKISQITKDIPNPSVLEIGGGLGRTAYYCRKFGIKNYTIVDIPISALAQGNFLGRVLPENSLTLVEEQDGSIAQENSIKLIHPNAFFASENKYDLIVNVDSLTELDIMIARQYMGKISQVGDRFLSINHELNTFSVHLLWKQAPILKKLYRNMNWLRRGYVDEFFYK